MLAQGWEKRFNRSPEGLSPWGLWEAQLCYPPSLRNLSSSLHKALGPFLSGPFCLP